jgi:hypothetical protein
LGKSIKNIDMPTGKQIENFLLTWRSIRAYSKKSRQDSNRENSANCSSCPNCT